MPTPGGVPADNVAPFQTHEVAQIRNEKRGLKYHRSCRSGLEALPIDLEPHGQAASLAHFVRRDEPRSNWAETIAAFTLIPLTSPFELKRTLGDIVANAVTGDRRLRRLLVDLPGPLLEQRQPSDLPRQRPGDMTGQSWR
jgi:hypothetical protein